MFHLVAVAASLTGATAAEELVKNLREGGCVDEHLQDQVTTQLISNMCIALCPPLLPAGYSNGFGTWNLQS